MARYTLENAQTFLADASAAYSACLSGREYKFKNRELKRQDLDMVKKEMDYWSKYVGDLQSGRNPDRQSVIRKVVIKHDY